MERDLGGSRGDQLANQATIQAHALSVDLGAGAAPVGECDVVAKLDADLLQDHHRGGIDTLDLFFIERLDQRQAAPKRRQHLDIRCPPFVPARLAAPSAAGHGKHAERARVDPSSDGRPECLARKELSDFSQL